MLRLSFRTVLALVLMTTGYVSPAFSQQADAPAKQYTPEQIEAAKKLAKQIGGQMKEDAEGNVISLDMAAGRSWADNYQMQQLLVFPKLATLVVEGPGITEALVPRILEQKNLTSLTLKNTLIGDRGIDRLSTMPSLKVLELRVAPLVTDKSMGSLVKMPNLRAVRLVGGNVTDLGVETLLQAPKLIEVDVRNCRKVTKKGVQTIADKGTIRTLKVGGPAIDDEALAIIGNMTKLTGLYLDNCPVTDAGLAKLGQLALNDLDIRQCPKVTDEGLAILANFLKLRQLTLLGVAAKGAALAKLPNPENLVTLNMAQSGISDAEIPNLGRFTKLENLNLNQTAVTNAAIETLAKLTTLKQLTMTQSAITAEGTEQLKKLLPNCAIRAN